jgi:serine/threonine protein kinase
MVFALDRSDGCGGWQSCVCKRLPPRMLREEAAQQAIRQEARALQALGGRGAPHWIADGDDEHGPFVVMERVAFPSLAERTDPCDRGFLDRATRSAFSSLALIHEASDAQGPLAMVHGDLSPNNLLVSASGEETRVIDFGLASWRDAPRAPGGAFRGTLLYAAPEVARGESFDARADRFALAASLAHAALGAPLRAASVTAALLADAAENPVDARALEGLFSKDIFEFLRACLAFDRKDRPRGVPPAGVENGT